MRETGQHAGHSALRGRVRHSAAFWQPHQARGGKNTENSQIVLYRLRRYFHKTLVPTLASLLSSHTQSFPRRYSWESGNGRREQMSVKAQKHGNQGAAAEAQRPTGSGAGSGSAGPSASASRSMLPAQSALSIEVNKLTFLPSFLSFFVSAYEIFLI